MRSAEKELTIPCVNGGTVVYICRWNTELRRGFKETIIHTATPFIICTMWMTNSSLIGVLNNYLFLPRVSIVTYIKYTVPCFVMSTDIIKR